VNSSGQIKKYTFILSSDLVFTKEKGHDGLLSAHNCSEVMVQFILDQICYFFLFKLGSFKFLADSGRGSRLLRFSYSTLSVWTRNMSIMIEPNMGWSCLAKLLKTLIHNSTCGFLLLG
jgi:hypothetical protein